MLEEKREQRMIAKKIKMMNNSFTSVSKMSQNNFGIVSVQLEDHVFFMGMGRYVKVYLIKPGVLSAEKRSWLTKLLIEKQFHRFRITCVNKEVEGGARGQFLFLSVTVEAEDYYNANQQFEETEKVIKEIETHGIDVKHTSVEEVLSYCRYNYTEDQVSMTTESVLKEDWMKLIFDSENSKSKKRLAFIGFDYPLEMESIRDALISYSKKVMVTADILPLDDEAVDSYEKYLKGRYNHEIQKEGEIYCNITYGVYITTSMEEAAQIKEKFLNDFYHRKIIFFHEKQADEFKYMNSCTMGLWDYHKNKIVNADIVPNLLL